MSGRERGQQTLTGGVTKKTRERPETFVHCFDCGEPILRGEVIRGEHDDDHTTALDDPYGSTTSERKERRQRWKVIADQEEQRTL